MLPLVEIPSLTLNHVLKSPTKSVYDLLQSQYTISCKVSVRSPAKSVYDLLQSQFTISCKVSLRSLAKSVYDLLQSQFTISCKVSVRSPAKSVYDLLQSQFTISCKVSVRYPAKSVYDLLQSQFTISCKVSLRSLAKSVYDLLQSQFTISFKVSIRSPTKSVPCTESPAKSVYDLQQIFLTPPTKSVYILKGRSSFGDRMPNKQMCARFYVLALPVAACRGPHFLNRDRHGNQEVRLCMYLHKFRLPRLHYLFTSPIPCMACRGPKI